MKINDCDKSNSKNDINVIYYAHHKWKYNTVIENEEIKIIKNKFKNSVIINPNGWIYQCGNENYIMNRCLQLIKNSDVVVFSTIEDNIIGKGVYDEIGYALRNNKKVYWLGDNFVEYSKDDFNKIELIYGDTRSKRKYAIIK